MSNIGKISVINKDYSRAGIQTMQSELAKKNMTRVPGTGVFKYPYKELDGKYRTGLDPDAGYIRRIADPLEKKLEIERIEKLLVKIKNTLGDIDLGPRSQYWNYGLSRSPNDTTHVQPVKLLDGDNIFDLNNIHQEIAFSWLRVHPTIASSFQAWERGEYPAETQYYVANDEIEQALLYKKKKLVNLAISALEKMSIERKRKIGRLMGLPITDDTVEEVVYNLIDNVLKQTEFSSGGFKGQSTINVFNRFVEMKENLLSVRDLVTQAIGHSIYRRKPNGTIYEGEYEVAKDEEALVEFLMDDKNQEDLMSLTAKLKAKKLASV